MDSFEIKYESLASIGIGCYSEVFKVRSRAHDDSLFAAKKIPVKYLNCADSTLLKEIEILKMITHSNIVSLLDYAASNDYIYLIMELAEGGDLFERIVSTGKFSEADTRRITRQMVDACAYLHSIDVVHRDLKPENVLFKSKDASSPIMITDFGLSALYTNDKMLKTACGTPGYAAPEVLQRVPYNEKVDSWSIGVITYILLCGYPPFYNEEDSDVLLHQQVLDCDFKFHSSSWDHISTEAKDFIRLLLVKDFRARLSCTDALRNTWLQKQPDSHTLSSPEHSKDTEVSGEKGSTTPGICEGIAENSEKESPNVGSSSQSNGLLAPSESIGDRRHSSGSQWQKAMDFVSAVENSFKSLNLL